jgi:GT2 family glycosyltransferase
MSRVSVITVNFNQGEVTEALLNSIKSLNSYKDIEIIVVDNGSSPNLIPMWVAKYPMIKFVRSDTNLGFAGGNNLGIKEASGEYLFFVNNDTEFTESLVSQLVKTLEDHEEIGIISPKIRYFDQPDTIQYAGFTKMNYYTARNKCIGQFEKDLGQYDHLAGETGYIHGAAMMVRKQAISTAGGMPEVYFLYYEEMDWCEQIKRAGFKIWIDTSAVIYHKESISVGAKSTLKEYFMNRNRILFIRRNCSFFTKTVFWGYFVLIVAPRNIAGYLKNRQGNFIGILLKAIAWNITHSISSMDTGFSIKAIK